MKTNKKMTNFGIQNFYKNLINLLTFRRNEHKKSILISKHFLFGKLKKDNNGH